MVMNLIAAGIHCFMRRIMHLSVALAQAPTCPHEQLRKPANDLLDAVMQTPYSGTFVTTLQLHWVSFCYVFAESCVQSLRRQIC